MVTGVMTQAVLAKFFFKTLLDSKLKKLFMALGSCFILFLFLSGII